MQTEQLLCWSDMTDTEHTTSGSNENLFLDCPASEPFRRIFGTTSIFGLNGPDLGWTNCWVSAEFSAPPLLGKGQVLAPHYFITDILKF